MKKYIGFIIILLFSATAFSQADNSDVRNTCDISGGTWNESGSGWACCWDDWGCYGCIDGICKIKCHNQRCRDANKIRANETPPKNSIRLEGLAPEGSMAPIAPEPKKQIKSTVAPQSLQ